MCESCMGLIKLVNKADEHKGFIQKKEWSLSFINYKNHF